MTIMKVPCQEVVSSPLVSLPIPSLLTLPEDVLISIIPWVRNPMPLIRSCSYLHHLFTTLPSIRAQWLIHRYGKAHVLFYPMLVERHPALDAATVDVLLNLGARFKFQPLFEDAPLPLPTLHSLACAAVGEFKAAPVRAAEPSVDSSDLFDLWTWVIQTCGAQSLIERLVKAGADPNYLDAFAVSFALQTRNAVLLRTLLMDLGASIPVVRDRHERSSQPPHSCLRFATELVSWYPAPDILALIRRCDAQCDPGEKSGTTKRQGQKMFWQQVGRNSRTDILRLLKMKPASPDWSLDFVSACAVFVGATMGGHLPLMTEMVLSNSVPIDHSSSIALQTAVRLMRSDLLYACLSLGATIPRSAASALAIDLLSWASTDAILAFLARADDRGRTPRLHCTESFLHHLGRCGRGDVIEALVSRDVMSKGGRSGKATNSSLALTSEQATTVLVGAAGAGHLDLCRDLVTRYEGDPVGYKFAAIRAACRSVKASSAEIIGYLLAMWQVTGDDDEDEKRFARRCLAECLVEACKFVGQNKVQVVECLIEWMGPAELRRVGGRALVEALRSWQWTPARVIKNQMKKAAKDTEGEYGVLLVLVGGRSDDRAISTVCIPGQVKTCADDGRIWSIWLPTHMIKEDAEELAHGIEHLIQRAGFQAFVQDLGAGTRSPRTLWDALHSRQILIPSRVCWCTACAAYDKRKRKTWRQWWLDLWAGAWRSEDVYNKEQKVSLVTGSA
ncbi:uncharacterized protein SPPG_08141 [Spizellomyces punctatus DAOM BR117]|uniref:Uncharacterized protein n=2 Tax=Spizellomyces punctatus (strain DAOM BR117) TaxID=645134 RepID=A0A0L0H6F0_SPIPD|nr:uncharacterized protein SPPG_08141 [Spizellomyces punctatus DAOM BR117]KNC96554.1 hypothetical protein SPPG_08141 [Spizellomyces punctatus DAOM BR117]|eukprot:XP_016604594.1 hypothetical protein SPPG_08141 [Spizellomyces punctatus DAOM BR117]